MTQAAERLDGLLGSVLSTFVSRKWEREPTVMPQATAPAFVSEEALLAALASASDAPPGDATNYVVWVDGQMQSDVAEFAAKASDRSLTRYIDRLARKVGSSDFTVLIANPHRYDDSLRRRITSFCRELSAHAGIPCGGFDSGVFLGRYGQTPFGVHRGQMSVLTFPILGSKRFLLWPYDYGDEHVDIQDSLQYDLHRPVAQVITAGPGDIAYWPADFWHVADGEVAVSAALNIGLWWDEPPLDLGLKAFGQLVAERHDEISWRRASLHAEPGSGDGLAAELQRSHGLIAAVAASDEFKAQVQLRWLGLQSSSGLRDPLPARPPNCGGPGSSLVVRLAAGETIHTARLATGRLGVAMIGEAVSLAAEDSLLAEIAALNRGAAVRVDPRATHPDDGSDRAVFARLLLESRAVLLDQGSD